MFWCCDPIIPKNPALVDISPETRNKWSVSTVKKNIKVVPYSHDVEGLKIIQGITEKYIGITLATENREDREKELSLLRQLKVLTEKRLEVAPYYEVIARADFVLSKKDSWNSADALIKELKEIRHNLSICERNSRGETDKITNFQKQHDMYSEQIRVLDFLFDETERGLTGRPDPNSEGDNDAESASDEKISFQKSSNNSSEGLVLWNIQQIQEYRRIRPKFSKEARVNLIEEIRVQKTECQKLQLEKEIQWRSANSYKQLLDQTIIKLKKVEGALDTKLKMNSSSLPKIKHDDDKEIELEKIDSKNSPLQEHKIKGATNKTYVALTEET